MQRGGDLKLIEPIIVEDVLDGLNAHRVQVVCRRFERVDLSRCKLVVRRLVPVEITVDRMKVETLVFDDPLPVESRRDLLAIHHDPPENECPVEPKP